MIMTKRIIAVLLAVLMMSAVLAGCEFGGGDTSSTPVSIPASGESGGGVASDIASAVDDAASSDDGSTTETLTGTGNNEELAFSMTLFDVEYTVGHSRVKDLTANNWGYDPEDWADVDMNQKIEYKSTGGSYKTLDNSTTEVEISYKNLAETFATPENCVISTMSFKGAPNASIAKAKAKLFGGKVDLTQFTSIETIDQILNGVFSSYTKETNAYTYSTYYYYEAELPSGKARIDVTVDNETNTVKNVSASLNLSYDFTYVED